MDVSPEFLFDAKRFFYSVLIEGIGNTRYALANQGIRLRVDLHVRGVRHLFDTDYDLHLLLLISL
jgi:hypothetical protein